MGAHALKDRVEGLAAETLSLSESMREPAEVLTIHRASIIQRINPLIDRTWALRAKYLSALTDIPCKDRIIREAEEGQDFAESKVALRSLIATLSRPTLVDATGKDTAEYFDEIAVMWSKKSSDDGRFVRRLVKRLREAGDACDIVRIKIYDRASEIVVALDRLDEAKAEDERDSDPHRYDDLFADTMSNYPIIMDYLAR